MAHLWMQYVLFLAKTVTVVVAIGTVLVLAFSVPRRGRDRHGERLQVTRLNERYENLGRTLRRGILPKKAFRKAARAEKKRRRAEHKGAADPSRARRPRAFVLNFHGDLRASAVASLREEITAVLSEAEANDEVVVRLENTGGLVHEHGLAASQLMRVRRAGIPLTVVVDKVAASGGYMMACVANRIVAAPFAILGSIGVLAEIPNFHRLLDRHGIDFELAKGGERKRTVTLFGKNTDEDRRRLREQVEDTHVLFKDFVATQRQEVDIARVATGEYWHATRALDLKLVDELMTSDDYLLTASREKELYEVSYSRKKPLGEALASFLQRSS